MINKLIGLLGHSMFNLNLLSGIFYMMAIVGPAIGYVIGGQLLLVYTDFLTDDPTV